MTISIRSRWFGLLALLILGVPGGALAGTRTLARHGRGFLEDVDGTKVLHLKGTAREMGVQHGVLLRDDIREQVRYLFDVKAKEFKPEVFGVKLPIDAKRLIGSISELQKKYVPDRFYDEMRGIAEGSGVAIEEVVAANFIPELFHCSGFALAGSATGNGMLYHGRVLDYGCDWRLQDHAVLVVAEPDGSIPFVNVTYAGLHRQRDGDEREEDLDRRDGGGRDRPLAGDPDGDPGPDGAGRGGHPRRGRGRVPRSPEDLPVLLRRGRRQREQGGRDGSLLERLRDDQDGRDRAPAAAPDRGRRPALDRQAVSRSWPGGSRPATARSTPTRPVT